MPRIFISHSSSNVQESNKVKEWLGENGFDLCFLDYHKQSGIPVGKDWERVLYDEIERSQAMIIILTQDWQASKWCFSEYTQARALGKAIYPLVFDGYEENQISGSIQYLDLTSDSKDAYKQLLKELTTLALNTQEGFEWDRTRSPYPGMLSFDEEDAAIFFGRDDDTLRVIERLNARRTQGGSRLLALLGASGSGKSSLLKAGVLPRLRRDKRHWIILPIFRPKLRPMRELAIALAVKLKKIEEINHFYQKLMEDDGNNNFLTKIADQIQQQALQFDATILISVDQSEELFSTSESKETLRFFKLISDLKYKEPPWLCIFTLRSDFLGYLQNTENLKTDFTEISLKPMPLSRIDSIIRGPAKVVGLTIDPELVAVATEDAKTNDALPLLAFALRQLYERFGNDGDLTLDEYKRLGDVKENLHPLENAVRKAADEAIEQSKADKETLLALRQAFIPAMVRVNNQGEYVRRSANWNDLPDQAYPLLEQLAAARLLTIKQSNNNKVIEVSHEALLRKWPLLQKWLREMHEFLEGKEHLERSIKDWQESDEPYKRNALLQGLALYRAKKWLFDYSSQLSSTEIKYIKESVALGKQKQRNIKIFAAGATALAIFTLVSLFFQIEAKKETTQQLVLNLMRQGIDARDNKKESAKAKLLFAKAVDLSTNKQEKRSALLAYNGVKHGKLLNILEQKQPVKGLVVSPDMKWFLSWNEDEHIRIWESMDQQTPYKLLSHNKRVRGAVISEQGDKIISWSDDNKVTLWDVKKNSEITSFKHGNTINGSVFSKDEKKILSWSDDKTIKVWNIDNNRLEHEYYSEYFVIDAKFMNDDNHIISRGIGNDLSIWNTGADRPVDTINLPNQISGFIALNNNLDVITWTSHKVIRIINIDTKEVKKIFVVKTHIQDVILTKDQQRFISVHVDGAIKLWDISTGKEILEFNHADAVSGALFSEDERSIISWSKDKTVRIWDISSKQEAMQMTHGKGVNGAIFNGINRLLSWSDDGSIRHWQVKMEPYLQKLPHNGMVYGIQYFDNKNKLISWTDDRAVTIWDTENGEMLSRHNTNKDDVIHKISLSHNEDRYLSWGKKHELRETILATGEVTFTIKKDKYIGGAKYFPDSNNFISWHHNSSNEGYIYIWSNKSGNPTTLHKCNVKHKVNGISFLPNDTNILVWSGGYSSGGSVDLIDCNNNNIIKNFIHEKNVNGALIIKNYKLLITWGDDKKIIIWDFVRKKSIKTLHHNSKVRGVIIKKNNSEILSWSNDRILRVWSLEDYSLLREMHHSERVDGATYFNKDAHIISWSKDNTVRIWDSNTGLELQRFIHTNQVTNALVDEYKHIIVSASLNNDINSWCLNVENRLSENSTTLHSKVFTGTYISNQGVVNSLSNKKWVINKVDNNYEEITQCNKLKHIDTTQ